MFKLKTKRKIETRVFLCEPENYTLENVIRNHFKKDSPERIDKSLFGHCNYCDGVYYFSWESTEKDFVISTPSTDISKKDLRRLRKIAKRQHKELYVHFNCTPKGVAPVVLSFVITEIAKGFLGELGKDLYRYFKDSIIDKINIEKNGPNNEEIEIYTDGNTDSPTSICIENKTPESLDNINEIIINRILKKEKKVVSYNKNGIVFEKEKNIIDINA